MISPAALRATDVQSGYGEALILKGVSVDVDAGGFLSIIGPNGSGKSTFLKTLAGIVPTISGRIDVDGASVEQLEASRRARRGVVFVPQEANVFATMSVLDNLKVGALLCESDGAGQVKRMLLRFPILAEKKHHKARTLSGGQRQILAMAIALMSSPRVMLLDEPSAGLSPAAAGELFKIVQDINASGITVILVEQNAYDAMQISRTTIVLVDGRVARAGSSQDLLADPTVRRLFLGIAE